MVLQEPLKQDACYIQNTGMRAKVERQCQRLGGCSACEFLKDGADVIESEVDALFDVLCGVASEEEDAARAHLGGRCVLREQGRHCPRDLC